jgi:hypothetical protein
MPISGCVPCRHFFLLDPTNSSGRRCSGCNQPLRMLGREEFQTLIVRLRAESETVASDTGGGC